MAKGAIGVILFNNEEGLLTPFLGTEDGVIIGEPFDIPVVLVRQAVGERLKNLLLEGTSVIAALQPLPPKFYAPSSGTSMASPHVAGVLALMRSVNPDLTPEEAKEILLATATQVVEASEEEEKEIDDVVDPSSLAKWIEFEYGAGLVNAKEAVEETLRRRRAHRSRMLAQQEDLVFDRR